MKFEVGEIAELVPTLVVANRLFPYVAGERVTIVARGPGLSSTKSDGSTGMRDYYIDGGKGLAAVDEPDLRKLPPDDHVSTHDTSEDPGLTRIKKLLQNELDEAKRHQQPQKA